MQKPIDANTDAKNGRSKNLDINDNLAESAYPMPRDAGGQDDVFVGRIRRDPSGQNSLAMWCVSDNLRKGAATNAVQIAEHVAREMTA